MPVNTQRAMPAKTSMKEYRQKLMTIKARMRYREQTIKGFKNHLKNGTIPKRVKSLLPCPNMAFPESQATVNAACEQLQVQSVILDQMMLEEEKRLFQDQDSYQTVKTQRQEARQNSRYPKTPRNHYSWTSKRTQGFTVEIC